ncbi:hypothetical protein BJX68DRAFT_152771 [Aspergillus pseudodeflectus]|uniref:Uncharacterized protein n=1 Tax=Aspergillus pseudodeflectus TaxID=176178 RepID=A0ABR4JXH6_9EURO
MSLPKPSPPLPLSSSPSKQSFRRLSRPHSIDQQLARTHDTPDEYPSQNHTPVPNPESHFAENETLPHHELPSPTHDQILSQPFFTLIEDAHTSEYYHPTVHYIFSDDDNDIVTEAALRSLESEQDTFLNTSAKGKSKAPGDNTQLSPAGEHVGNYDEGSARRKESLLPEPIPGVRENFIILDIDHTPIPHQGTEQTAAGSPDPQAQAQAATQGDAKPPREAEQPSSSQPHQFTITSAHSLSPSWQVLNTSIAPAPTFETNASAENPVNGGLMLQIQGTSGLPIGMLGKDTERGSQRLEDMMDQFARRLDELRLVIENGEQNLPSGPEEMSEEPLQLEEPGAQDAQGGLLKTPGEDEVSYAKEEGSAP